jgi:hypothetical protein
MQHVDGRQCGDRRPRSTEVEGVTEVLCYGTAVVVEKTEGVEKSLDTARKSACATCCAVVGSAF